MPQRDEELLKRLYEMLRANPISDDLLSDPPSHTGPVRDPERFVQLTTHQRQWLAGKSEAELIEIDAMLKDYRGAKAIGLAGKWLFWIVGGIFATSFAIAKFGLDILRYLKMGGP